MNRLIKRFLLLTFIFISGTVLTGCFSRVCRTVYMEETIVLEQNSQNISEIYEEIQINFEKYIDTYELGRIEGSFIGNPDEDNISYTELTFSFSKYINRFGEGGLYSEIYITADLEEGTATIKEDRMDGKASTLPSTELTLDEDTIREIEEYLMENSSEKEQGFRAWRTIGSIEEVIKPGKLAVWVYKKDGLGLG